MDDPSTPDDLGSYLEHDGRPAVRFERTYPHPVQRVWAAITDPAELVRWFPSAVELQPREGGTVRFSGDPYSEGSTGAGRTRLVLVDVLDDRSRASRRRARTARTPSPGHRSTGRTSRPACPRARRCQTS